jgi:DNA invertase Pin-like site-specific DNA recombinase
MLNMLLSFAQYEREVTGERIRDKFAESKKKGIWMGGCVPLGYEVKDRKLIVVEEEAKIIRFIYDEFLKTESYCSIVNSLNKLGYRTKIRRLRSGRSVGGQMFEPKAVLKILRTLYYKGCIPHKDKVYKGEHKGIIDEQKWEKVQEIFEKHSEKERPKCKSSNRALLSGLIRCATCGCLMAPTSSKKNGTVKYHYYTCYNHWKYKACKAIYKTVPAEPIERNVIEEILRLMKSPEIVVKINKLAEKQNEVEKSDFLDALKNLSESWEYLYVEEKRKILQTLVKNVNVVNDGIKINLNLEEFNDFLVELAV